MKLQLNHTYRSRENKYVTIVKHDSDENSIYPWLGSDGSWYTSYGSFDLDSPNSIYDLVSEVDSQDHLHGEPITIIDRDEKGFTYTADTPSIECTLETRQTTHGDFTLQASTSQSFKDICRLQPNWDTMSPSHRESIDMILHKLSRILSGDPDFVDSWRDIEGYSALVRKHLESSGAKDVRQEYFNHPST